MPRKALSTAAAGITELEEAVRQAGDVRAQVDAILRLAHVLGNSDPRRALALSGEALRIAASVNYEAGIAWSHRRRAYILNLTGKSLAGLAAAREALGRFQKLGDPLGEAAALRDLGATSFNLGRLRTGLAYFQRARAISERLGDLRGAAVARLTLGQIHAQLDENQAALDHFAAALSASRRLGDALGVATARFNAGVAERNLGRPAAARRHYQAALTLARRRGYKRLEAEALVMCAELDLDARRWSRALAGFQLGAALAEELDAISPRLNAQYGLGQVALAQGDLGTAAQCFSSLRTLAADADSRYGMVLAWLGQGNLALLAGRRQEARRHARAALALAQEIENREYKTAARQLLAAAENSTLRLKK